MCPKQTLNRSSSFYHWPQLPVSAWLFKWVTCQSATLSNKLSVTNHFLPPIWMSLYVLLWQLLCPSWLSVCQACLSTPCSPCPSNCLSQSPGACTSVAVVVHQHDLFQQDVGGRLQHAVDCPQQGGPGLIVEGNNHRGCWQRFVVIFQLSATTKENLIARWENKLVDVRVDAK